jgi:hypothetical protein
MDLMLDVPLTTQETIMKYIRGLSTYIRNIVFMFGPSNLDSIEENLSCKHYKKEGHDDEHCWRLHPEKRPKWLKERKGRQKVATTT